MDIQLSILQYFQSIRNPILNMTFLLFTISTELPVIVLITAFTYWCINKKYGQKILFSLVGNITINTSIKDFFKAPRPIGMKGIESLRVSTATGYSFPSGHTQTATSFWTSIMIIFRKTWIYILGTIMILSIGISRLYLAVHWPIDVIFGWTFGIIFTILISKIFDYVDENKKYSIFIFILILFIIIAFFLNSESYIKVLGLLTGLILGYIIEDKFIQFETGNNNKQTINFSNRQTKKRSRAFINLIRFILGILTLALVYILLKVGMPYILELIELKNLDFTKKILDYIRYTIVMFYGVAGVPALFKAFKLS
ncbi:phosphatase PAP2 family protein [Romboutsia maritimum]|uniref:Phosphatase PAP2 family protein n=1 Tax=Romboutsia maritimum TaxID=2020948 RepID=A0A371IWX2_9FIRM|nr:phosphatase PAP2 family protein [Romboutsia maritimum]RDY24976.1 phosphatase PAP2 family protein [Romboutsia maritimum]